MYFERFFDNLEGEYKTMLLALVVIFPMAYADCWKLSPTFPSIDLIPQIILALGVSVILMYAGLVLDLVFLASLRSGKIEKKLSFPVLLIPTVILSGLVIIGVIDSVPFFTSIFVGFFGICIIAFIYKVIKDYQKDKKKK